ncbi:unnamed protein product [Discosporangium mesarthrocarpum]
MGRHFPDSPKARRAGTAILALSLALPLLGIDLGGGQVGGHGPGWREIGMTASGAIFVVSSLLALTGLVSPTSLVGRYALCISVGGSIGAWCALSSASLSSTSEVVLAASGAAGTLSAAAMVLTESVFPRVGRQAGAQVGGVHGDKGAHGGSRGRSGGGVGLLELYVCALFAMPTAAIGQVRYEALGECEATSVALPQTLRDPAFLQLLLTDERDQEPLAIKSH